MSLKKDEVDRLNEGEKLSNCPRGKIDDKPIIIKG